MWKIQSYQQVVNNLWKSPLFHMKHRSHLILLIGGSSFTWNRLFYTAHFYKKRDVSNAMLKPIVLIVCAGFFIRNTEPYFNRWIKLFHMKQWALSSLESILFHMKQTIEFCPGLFLLSKKKPEKHICSSGRLMVIINH